MLTDEQYMQRALELAIQAEGDTSPNPMVGCVIVADDGSIVGEGYHHKALTCNLGVRVQAGTHNSADAGTRQRHAARTGG